VQTVLAPVLLIVVMAAIFIIAKEVELRKIQGWSIVNTALIVIAMIFEIISMFVNSGEAIARLGLVWIILRVLYSAFTLVILFNCYARICYEDDADMEKSTTGMPVFDTLNRMLDKATKKKDGNNKKEDK
jgi:ABC-type polysaccharide/polyol phosphate export permease